MLFSRHAAVADEPEIYRSYELKHQTASEAESVLAEMLESLSEPVLLVVDAKKNRLLLSGPAKAHQIASSVLATIDRPAPLATPAVIEPVLKIGVRGEMIFSESAAIETNGFTIDPGV